MNKQYTDWDDYPMEDEDDYNYEYDSDGDKT